MASMGRFSIGVSMIKTTPSRTSTTSRTSPASMASVMMALHGVLLRCRYGFDGARVRVSPLKSGHQRRLCGAGCCGSRATSMKHGDGLMDVVCSLNV